jgi:hypothetical protein
MYAFPSCPCPRCGGAVTLRDVLRVPTPYGAFDCRGCGARLGFVRPGATTLAGLVAGAGLGLGWWALGPLPWWLKAALIASLLAAGELWWSSEVLRRRLLKRL